MDLQEHWNRVYTTKSDEELSWFESVPAASIRMLKAAGLTSESCVLDVGGGDSRLVDYLLSEGLRCIAVLDVSGAALQRAKSRMCSQADHLTWIESDVTGPWSLRPIDIWHDRAVFHFLIEAAARMRYRERLVNVLKPGGSAVIATFAPDGPEKCSGLPVARYSPEALAAELGPELCLIDSQPFLHKTPWGINQSFQYSRFMKH